MSGLKPTNIQESGCDPMSSNCVIWQGPDIECINLCKGDSITAVVFKLATELCTLMDILDITNYDLACFNLLECGPQDFRGLIQLLIDRVCELEGVSPTPSTGSGCPDCVVNTCSVFHYYNPQGDLVTSMQLVDYVIAIGNRVCSIVGQIATINATLTDHEDRITNLENEPDPECDLPQIVPMCVISSFGPPTPVDMDVVLAALEEQFCILRMHIGNPNAILLAIQAACVGLNSAPRLNGIGTMSSIPGWFPNPVNLSQSFSNLWKTVCDMRLAVQYIQNNCCDTDCDSIDLDIVTEIVSPTVLRITFLGTVPADYADSAIGSTLHITDSGGGGPQIINNVYIKSQYLLTGTKMNVNLAGINAANDLTIMLTSRFTNPTNGSSCDKMQQFIALGTNTCPPLVLTAGYNNVNVAFTWNGPIPTSVTLQLLNAAGTSILQSTVINIISTNPSGNFLGLLEGTLYNVRLVIHGVPCELSSFTTLAYPCIAPTLNAPTIDYSDPEGDTQGNTIEGWQVEYDFYHP